jgi:predicted DNA-binding transcriptional regulator YafY
MAGHKTTYTQLERFRLIDSILADGEVVPFEKILESLRLELRDDLLSESSLRRDFRYMKNPMGAPLAYDKKLHGWHYTKPYKLPAESFSDDELLCLELIRKLIKQSANDDCLYKSFDKLLSKIMPESSGGEQETPKCAVVESVETTLSDRFYIPPRPKPLVDDDVMEKVLDAIKNNYLLDFNYFSKWEPEERHRKIMPYQLIIDEGSMFLYGANFKTPDNPRLFKITKMHDVQVVTSQTFNLPANFRFREKEENGRFGAFQYDDFFDFKIEFYGEARSLLHEYIWSDNQIIEEKQQENKSIISFTSSQWEPVQKWVLSFGENVRPLEPDWFVVEWKEKLQKSTIRF